MAGGQPAAAFICPGHSRPVVGLQYSQTPEDGPFLISACHDKTAMLRDGETGDWIGTFEGHNGAVWWAALNRGATMAATVSGDFTAKVWDATTGNEWYTFKHNHIVRTVDWSADSTCLATGGKEALIRLFDLGRPDAEPQVARGHQKMIKVLLWDDDDRLLTGADDQTLRSWDPRTLGETACLPLGGPVTSIHDDGSALLTVAAGDDVVFLDRQSLREHHRLSLPHVGGVNSAALHPDGGSIAVGGGNFWVYLLDSTTGAVRCRAAGRWRTGPDWRFPPTQELQCSKGHHGPVYCVRFAPDGKRYTSGGDDGTIRCWSINSQGGG